MLWLVSLNYHFTGDICSTRSTCYLGQYLKDSLRCTKVRNMKADIPINNSDQGNIRQIVPLGDHLGPDQHVDLP
jgi:hypothetical protein